MSHEQESEIKRLTIRVGELQREVRQAYKERDDLRLEFDQALDKISAGLTVPPPGTTQGKPYTNMKKGKPIK